MLFCRNEDVTSTYIYAPTDMLICGSADAKALDGDYRMAFCGCIKPRDRRVDVMRSSAAMSMRVP